MSDRFLGAWRVSEYIYDPDGTFRGIVRQRRILEQLESGAIRLIQECRPEQSLSGHPMSHFEGRWVFSLKKEGRKRHYLGPDVVGAGLMWREGWMTGAGFWPRFGYGFQSYAVLPQTNRQCTGGVFSRMHNTMCLITGVAVPETKTEAESWPSLDTCSNPSALSFRWVGTLYRYDNMGVLIDEDAIERVYTAEHSFSEKGGWFSGMVSLEKEGSLVCSRLSEKCRGFWTRYGARWSFEAFGSHHIVWMELFDADTQTISVIRSLFSDGSRVCVELVQLRASETTE